MSCLIWGVDQGSCAWVLVPSSWVSLLNLMLQGSLRGIWFHRAWAPRQCRGERFLRRDSGFLRYRIGDSGWGSLQTRACYIPWLQILWFQFYDYKCLLRVCLYASHFSHVWLFVTPWTVACRAPLSTGFTRHEYWRELPCPPPGDLPDPGIKPMSVSLLQW